MLFDRLALIFLIELPVVHLGWTGYMQDILYWFLILNSFQSEHHMVPVADFIKPLTISAYRIPGALLASRSRRKGYENPQTIITNADFWCIWASEVMASQDSKGSSHLRYERHMYVSNSSLPDIFQSSLSFINFLLPCEQR